jgi:hypothetical protein
VIGAAAFTACSPPTEAPPAPAEDAQFVAIETLGPETLLGSWTSEGGDCETPDFTIADDGRRQLAVSAAFNGWDRTGRVEDDGATFRFADPTKRLPVALEDGGIRVRAPSDGLAVLGSRNLFAEGVLFRKCLVP